MYQASLHFHQLNFKVPSGTSRGVLTTKDAWFIKIWKQNQPDIIGIGEASIIQTLSPDWNDEYPAFIEHVVENINDYIDTLKNELIAFPSIHFAIETALLDLKNGGNGLIFPSAFTHGKAPISINGLIWMGKPDYMLQQIKEKIDAGFNCIKLKIGAIDFEEELRLLAFIRSNYTANEIEIRVDANGAFHPEVALSKLKALAKFDLHSIEQPIKQGQIDDMKDLCSNTPLPIALDEELIGITNPIEKTKLLDEIRPQYIILKPSLIGGFSGTDEWIKAAESNDIKWWITSALESNIGLNAIAQYTFTKKNPMPQGLGTGQLFTNNTDSSLRIDGGCLYYE
ncbi:o-succinylbenzoate synthase [Crocinitomix algicola]|uniref:o-succinylbenzoate synthase n=1 Tax=Crocinitomix algicola TaxID=1740263 RepID=UPI000873232D|nr:o-succinylbenzoate synthase [Crocinitomix algicola]